MTLAFEYANSKLLDVVSVADVDARECVDNSLVEIMKLKFEEILKLNICQVSKQIFCQSGAEAEFRSRF